MASIGTLSSPQSLTGMARGAGVADALGQRLKALEAVASTSDNDKLKAKANEFESYYIQQFIALTKPDQSDNPVFGGGFAEQNLSDKMDENIASNIQKHGGFGLANHLYAQLLAAQDAGQTTAVAPSINPVTQP